jgi:hypothetical protein
MMFMTSSKTFGLQSALGIKVVWVIMGSFVDSNAKFAHELNTRKTL